MAAYIKFQPFVQNMGRKVFNLHTDVLKVMLTNVDPLVTFGVKADITEIAAGNGYVAGGVAVANQSFTQTGGIAKLIFDDPVITAVGGPIGPKRWAVLYDDTAANKELIGAWDYGSSSSINDGEDFIVDASQVNGVGQLT